MMIVPISAKIMLVKNGMVSFSFMVLLQLFLLSFLQYEKYRTP